MCSYVRELRNQTSWLDSISYFLCKNQFMELPMQPMLANHVIGSGSYHSLSLLDGHECWFREFHNHSKCLICASYLAITLWTCESDWYLFSTLCNSVRHMYGQVSPLVFLLSPYRKRGQILELLLENLRFSNLQATLSNHTLSQGLAP